MEPTRGSLPLRAGPLAALAILPLTPLLAPLMYQLAFRIVLGPSLGMGAYLNGYTVQWTVLLVAFAVALVPAGLILMRRPDASASWTLGTITIALGLIGVAYAVSWILLVSPDTSPLWIRMLVALCLVPPAAGILLMRSRGISGVRALGISTIALGIIGAVYYVPEIPSVLTIDAPSWNVTEFFPLWNLVTFFAAAISLTIVPLIVGTGLIRRKEAFAVRALGTLVIMLGVIGAAYRAGIALLYLMYFDQWNVSIVVELSMFVAAVVVPAIAGTQMIRNKSLSVVQAIGLTAMALGVIGLTYSMSMLMSILLLFPAALVLEDIVLAILLFAPLIAAIFVVPSGAGVLLMRRARASGAWALGLVAMVVAVVGTTFSAAQLLASAGMSNFNLFVGIHLLNTAWRP